MEMQILLLTVQNISLEFPEHQTVLQVLHAIAHKAPVTQNILCLLICGLQLLILHFKVKHFFFPRLKD